MKPCQSNVSTPVALVACRDVPLITHHSSLHYLTGLAALLGIEWHLRLHHASNVLINLPGFIADLSKLVGLPATEQLTPRTLVLAASLFASDFVWTMPQPAGSGATLVATLQSHAKDIMG